MNQYKTLALTMIFFSTPLIAEESYLFETDSPKVQIAIPEIPNITMKPHPLRAVQPEMRFTGSQDGYSISIIMPTSTAEVSAKNCADSITKDITEEFGIQEQQAFFDSAGNNTFQFRYALPLADHIFQLNSHIISSHANKQCVHVHISKLTKKISDIEAWATGFSGATIKSL